MSTETLEREPADLVTIEPKDAFAVFTAPDFKLIAPILDRVRKEVSAFKPGDVKTEAGRKSVKAMARKVMKSRTYLKAIGDDLAREAKEVPKKIDATRRHITDELEALEAKVLQPVTDWEAAETARQDKHKATIAALEETIRTAATLDLASLTMAITCVSNVMSDEGEEYADEIARLKVEASTTLCRALDARKKAEAEAAELAALRAEKEARERLDREADIRAQAAEEARKSEATKAQAAIDAANKAREDAERRATDAAQAAIREQEAKAAAEAKAATERERDAKHKGAINRAAVKAFVDGGMSEDVAKLAVTLIAKKQIPSITIAY